MKLHQAIPALLLCVPAALLAGDDAPRWLAAAAQYQPSGDAARAPAVVLWHEAEVGIDGSGKITTTERYAVRILKREGRSEAVAVQYYAPDTDKVHELRGWLMTPSGQVRALGKDYITDMEPGDSLYEQGRIRTLSAKQECGEGWIFAYESQLEERSVFTQLEWHFQRRLPVVMSRYTLHLPREWESKPVMLNHAPMEPAVSGNSASWELRNLPYLEVEPGGPEVSALAPRLAISLFPAGKTTLGETFAKWQDVSRYALELHDPQSHPDAAITARVQSLLAGKTTEIDKIRAIAGYVQNLRYVSIQTQLGHGGGYRPHPAALTFAKGYGDCKDKANLMRAMLRAAGITSYPVLVYAEDPLYVHEQWPSPAQFNHCIIAILVSDGVTGYAVVQVPRVGRLLIFDSTDPYTPLGDLPDHEQSSLALIAAGENGALIRVPERPAESNRLERVTDLTVGGDGSLRGSIDERFTGRLAVHARAVYRVNTDMAKLMESSMARQLPGVSISALQPTDSFVDNSFRLAMQIGVPYYAQSMQGRMLIFRPAAVPRSEAVPVSEAQRKYPLVIKGESFRETVKARIPASFEVDELPEAKTVATDLGVFTTSCTAKDGEVIWTRTLEIKAQIVPAERYGEIRDFFQRAAAVESEPVVLVKK